MPPRTASVDRLSPEPSSGSAERDSFSDDPLALEPLSPLPARNRPSDMDNFSDPLGLDPLGPL
jgi:hypothetical protein